MLVKDYDLHYSNGTLINISADYEKLPSKCSSCNIFRHTTTIFSNNKVDKLWIMEERENGVVRIISSNNKSNQLQWQEVVKRNKSSKNDENSQSMFGVYKSDCNVDETIIFVSILNSPRGGKVKEQGSTCDVLALSTIETTNCETTNRKSI